MIENEKQVCKVKCSSNEPLIDSALSYSWEEYANWRREAQQKCYI